STSTIYDVEEPAPIVWTDTPVDEAARGGCNSSPLPNDNDVLDTTLLIPQSILGSRIRYVVLPKLWWLSPLGGRIVKQKLVEDFLLSCKKKCAPAPAASTGCPLAGSTSKEEDHGGVVSDSCGGAKNFSSQLSTTSKQDEELDAEYEQLFGATCWRNELKIFDNPE
ncbi:unnamed protein product, partial [Amoebophrya sp. A120]